MTATVNPFSRGELQAIYGLLDRLNPLHMRPLSPEEVIRATELKDRAKALIESGAGATQRGRKVFEVRLPQADAPTQNMIRGMAFGNPFVLKGIEQRIEKQIKAAIEATEGAMVYGDKTQRWVRATRFTPQPKSIDDPGAADAIGAKMGIDALVRCKVLNGDTPALCRREAGVAKTFKKNTHLLLEVFEVADEEVPDPGPQDAPVEQRKKRRGPLAQAIADSGPAKPKRRARAKKHAARPLVGGTQ